MNIIEYLEYVFSKISYRVSKNYYARVFFKFFMYLSLLTYLLQGLIFVIFDVKVLTLPVEIALFLFAFTLIFLNFIYLPRLDRRQRYEAALSSAAKAANWKGIGPVRISAPSQGLNLVFANNDTLIEDLQRTASTIFELKRQAEDENVSNTVTNNLLDQFETLDRLTKRIRNEDFKAAADFEDLLEQSAIPHPNGTVGRFVFGDDKARKETSHALSLRLLAYIMFFKTESNNGRFVPIIEYGDVDAFYAQYPGLRESGPYQVLFELSLNAGRALAEVNQEKDELRALKSELVQALENARATLKLKPAANRWQNSARMSALLALVGLAPFLLLLFGVPYLVWTNWDVISTSTYTLFHVSDEETKNAIKTWQGFFKDAPWATFVFVTVPVLMFAWTLKHFSRIFVQNMNLASDAGRRAALADVYTRIVSDPDLNQDGNRITDEQKKIIFEAMFRPRDARHTDDGIDHSPVENLVSAVKGDGK